MCAGKRFLAKALRTEVLLSAKIKITQRVLNQIIHTSALELDIGEPKHCGFAITLFAYMGMLVPVTASQASTPQGEGRGC